MKNSDIAVGKFKEGYNCAQSTLFGYAEKLNIDKNMALKIANGFGGGMGRKQEVCGAVSGAILVLGLMYGRGENESKEKQDLAYLKVRNLIDAFRKEFGTINCKELLSGCELLTEEGQKMFKESGLHDKCCEYVRSAVRILDEINWTA